VEISNLYGVSSPKLAARDQMVQKYSVSLLRSGLFTRFDFRYYFQRS